MSNIKLSEIDSKIKQFDSMAPFKLEPYWSDMMPDFGDDDFWKGGVLKEEEYSRLLLVSGPARNGNHLIHSLLDNHPWLARAAGEDAFLAALFKDLKNDLSGTLKNLKSDSCLDYILTLSGHGINKWKMTWENQQDGDVSIKKTDIWSGVFQEKHFVSDYQDTQVRVDYPSFENRLYQLSDKIRNAPSLIDLYWLYLDALTFLDPQKADCFIPRIIIGSGMRAEMKFLFDRIRTVRCVAPIRPFELFYPSFVKGRLNKKGIDKDTLQEAWEHWMHKTVDYLLIKKNYPNQICLVNFMHVIERPKETAESICQFLKIDYSNTCLTPTCFGFPTKGNSSFPKSENFRGKFYETDFSRALPKEYWPDAYVDLWKMVEAFSV